MKVVGKPKPVDVVVKGNALVHASYVMERQEKMLMWFVIWAFQQSREKRLTIKCLDVAEFAGMHENMAYAQTWMVARRLRERELLLFNPDSDRVGACGFLSYVEYGKDRSGELDVVITDEIVPHVEKFIEEMKIGFTKFEMGVIAALKSFYSLRLYEICKSMNYGEHKKEGFEFSVEDLRKRFGVYVLDQKGNVIIDSYGEWFRFRQKVLDKAVKEVNEASDLRVTYKLRKNGRDIVAVRFFVEGNRAGSVVMESEPRDQVLMQRMSRLGVSATMMKKLFAEFGESDRTRLEYALRETEVAVKGGKIKNTAAWFVAAVKRDDRKQGELFTPEQRAKERELEKAEIEADRKKREAPGRAGSGTQSVSDVLKSVAEEGPLAEALRKMAAGIEKSEKAEMSKSTT